MRQHRHPCPERGPGCAPRRALDLLARRVRGCLASQREDTSICYPPSPRAPSNPGSQSLQESGGTPGPKGGPRGEPRDDCRPGCRQLRDAPLKDFHKLVSWAAGARPCSTMSTRSHQPCMTRTSEPTSGASASALNNEDLRADVHNVGNALADENLLESIGRLAVVSHQLRSELEPARHTGCHSYSAARTGLSTWATRSPHYGPRRTRWSTWYRESGLMPGRSSRRKA